MLTSSLRQSLLSAASTGQQASSSLCRLTSARAFASEAWKAWQPFASTDKIKMWKAKYMSWPPPDATPPLVIEPWGKHFFVYHGRENVEATGDPRAPDSEDVRPEFVQDDIRRALNVLEGPDKMTQKEANLDENKKEPVLCVTDYRQRPLCYFSREEWDGFVKAMPLIREELTQLSKGNAKDQSVEVLTHQRIYDPDYQKLRAKSASGKSGPRGGHDGHRRLRPHSASNKIITMLKNTRSARTL